MKLLTSNKILSLLFFGILFLLFNFFCPAIFNYHEQNSIFLFKKQFLLEELFKFGGLTSYLSDFFTQFFYIVSLGAIIFCAIIVLVQILLYSIIDNKNNLTFSLSFLPSIFIVAMMLNHEMLIDFSLGLLLTLLTVKFVRNKLIFLLVFPFAYYFVGSVFLIAAICFLIKNYKNIFGYINILLAVFCPLIAPFVFRQIPNYQFILGNYCRILGVFDYYIIAVVISIAIILILQNIINLKINKYILFAIWISFLAILVKKEFKSEIYSHLQLDYYLRHQNYNRIIKYAKENKLLSDIQRVALNLSLAQRDLFPDNLFDFEQSPNSLQLDFVMDNFTNYATVEVFENLGLINNALQYIFDTNAAISNKKQSARCYLKMAELYFINQNYVIALKYINKLKSTIYYRKRAQELEDLINNPNKIENSKYAILMHRPLKENFLFGFSEISIIYAKLFESNPSQNIMAYHYALCNLLLNRDLDNFVKLYQYFYQKCNVALKNKIYQLAWGLYWSNSHPNFEGMPFEISKEVQQEIITFAKFYDPNIQNYQEKFGCSFLNYFFTK